MTRAPIEPLKVVFQTLRRLRYHIIHTREGGSAESLFFSTVSRVWVQVKGAPSCRSDNFGASEEHP